MVKLKRGWKRERRKKRKRGKCLLGKGFFFEEGGKKSRRSKPTELAVVQRRRNPMPLTVQMAVFGTAAKHTMPCGKTAPHTHTAKKYKTVLSQNPVIMSAS